MATVVAVRRVTTGTEAQRLLDELAAALDVPFEDASEVRRILLGDADAATARAEVEAVLDRLSVTWSIHLRLEDG